MQVLVMTSDNKESILRGFFAQWLRYYHADCNVVVCGFTPISVPNFWKGHDFFKIGRADAYPPNRWSDALYNVLASVADEVFLLLLDDYWLTRQTDTAGVKIAYDYMHQFKNVLKFDLTSDRLNADPGKYAYNYHTYNVAGHLDLIKSDFTSHYHMSLWGGLWRRDLMKSILVPDETAQQIELNGTARLAQYGDEYLVLGSRQSPMKHANVIQGGAWNMDSQVGLPSLNEADRAELRRLGIIA